MRCFFLFHPLVVLIENMIGSLIIFIAQPELFTRKTYFDKVLHKVVPMGDHFMMQVPSNGALCLQIQILEKENIS